MAKTWTIVAAAALALLLVASVVVAVLESEEPFEAGTAEAAVQDFLRAVEDDEFETVYGFLSAELREECSVEQVFASPFRYRTQFDQNRITLEQTNEGGGSTFVTILISSFEGSGLFGSSESSFLQQYALKQAEDQWQFVQFPWPLFGCGAPKTVPEVSGPDPSLPVRGPDPGLPVRTPEAGTVPVREK